MVNHLSGHSTIYADVLACDETCLFGTEEKYPVGNVERIADSACRLLVGIGTLILFIVRIYPFRRDGIDTSLACENENLLAVTIDVQLSTSYRNRQFFILVVPFLGHLCIMIGISLHHFELCTKQQNLFLLFCNG